jgi:hypothetical protein
MILLLVLLSGRDSRQFKVILKVVSNFYSYLIITKEGDLDLVRKSL